MQSEIISGIYNQIYESLEKLAKSTKLFSFKENSDCYAQFGVVDICQESMDKSGQNIIFEEKEFKVPSFFEICFSVKLSGKDITKLLDAYAKIAVYFKDNNTVNIGKWNWHENPSDKIYLEPVIRPLEQEGKFMAQDSTTMELRFRTTFALNSENGRAIRRVEQKIINSNVM